MYDFSNKKNKNFIAFVCIILLAAMIITTVLSALL